MTRRVTKAMPKEILPLIQYAIDEARATGIEEFIFVTAKGKSVLEDYFDAAPVLEQALEEKDKDELLAEVRKATMDSGAIAYLRQGEALGLGHAVWCAHRLIGDESVAVILPDDVIAAETPCLKQMVEAHACRDRRLDGGRNGSDARGDQFLWRAGPWRGGRPGRAGDRHGREAENGRGPVEPGRHRALHHRARGLHDAERGQRQAQVARSS